MAKNPEKKLSEPSDLPKIIKDTIKKPRLLIIAEDDDIRQSAVLAGGKENFAVRAVENGSDALNLLINTDYKPFELLIVEHSLPGMRSDAICREICKNDLQTPILVMSTASSDIVLSLARFFLFGARDVWFAVALPVFLEASLGWRFWEIGGFLGLWVIGYGIVQGSAPGLRRFWGQTTSPGVSAVQFWSALLTAIPALIAMALWREVDVAVAITAGLAAFGVVFVTNSSIHSYMVQAYTDAQSVSLDVGFYYMANDAGRLAGTLLSGAVFMLGRSETEGMQACPWASSLLVLLSWISSLRLPALQRKVG